MKPPSIPITDNHIHLDPLNGRGLEAAKDFRRAGGTHMILVSKPSWSHGILPENGSDFSTVFEETIRIADQVKAIGIQVFVVLGVHPAEITRLSGTYGIPAAVEIMKGGLSCAARYVREGTAVGLKSGRPHYPVAPELMEASLQVLQHALVLCAENDCALQIHAESGACEDIVGMACRAGMDPRRVVKHFAVPETPLVPSLMAQHPAVADLAMQGREFLLESDFMDENTRPGAVTGPKSVPRTTLRLIAEGKMSRDQAWQVHAGTPSRVYGVEIRLR